MATTAPSVLSSTTFQTDIIELAKINPHGH